MAPTVTGSVVSSVVSVLTWPPASSESPPSADLRLPPSTRLPTSLRWPRRRARDSSCPHARVCPADGRGGLRTACMATLPSPAGLVWTRSLPLLIGASLSSPGASHLWDASAPANERHLSLTALAPRARSRGRAWYLVLCAGLGDPSFLI